MNDDARGLVKSGGERAERLRAIRRIASVIDTRCRMARRMICVPRMSVREQKRGESLCEVCG